MNRIAQPYIQNHINWCWAVVSEIVGFQYCVRNNRFSKISLEISKPHANTRRTDLRGLRPYVCGICEDSIVVDSIQLDIVEHAKSTTFNHTGNFPEDDIGKARALRYVITGNSASTIPQIVIAGNYYDDRCLLNTERSAIDEAIALGNSFIGNYRRQDGTFHSIVLKPVSASWLELYDPWDGYKAQFRTTQIFKSGFLTNQGIGVIKWIQYIHSVE